MAVGRHCWVRHTTLGTLCSNPEFALIGGMKKYTYPICGLFVIALAYFTISGCETTSHRTFRFDSTFDRPERPETWKQVRSRCDGRWCAGSFTHRGSSLRRYPVPRATCHICERKWPDSLCQPDKDCYGRKGASLQLHCDVAGEALSPAIIHQKSVVSNPASLVKWACFQEARLDQGGAEAAAQGR